MTVSDLLPLLVPFGLAAAAALVLLVLGSRALRAGRAERAEDLATTAGVLSLILLGLEALFGGLLLLRRGLLLAPPPEWQPFFALGPALWFWARALHGRARRRREEAAVPGRPGSPPLTGEIPPPPGGA